MSRRFSNRGSLWVPAAVLAASLFAAGFAVAGAGSPGPDAPPALQAEVPPFPSQELPPEWRWQRKAIKFDHMFRQMR